MKQALCAVIIVSSVIASAGQEKSWPALSAMHDAESVPVSRARLSQNEVAELKHIALSTANPKCRTIADDTLNQKLLFRRISGSKTVILQAGGDWEDSADNCFLGRGMNVTMWVIDLSEGHSKVLLQVSATAYTVMDSASAEHFDIVTATDSYSAVSLRRVELTWWRFDGLKYAPLRCATEQFSTNDVNKSSRIEQLQRKAKITEHRCRF